MGKCFVLWMTLISSLAVAAKLDKALSSFYCYPCSYAQKQSDLLTFTILFQFSGLFIVGIYLGPHLSLIFRPPPAFAPGTLCGPMRRYKLAFTPARFVASGNRLSNLWRGFAPTL